MRERLKALAFLVVLVFMAAGSSHGADPEITLRSAGDLPIGNHLTRAQEYFAKRVDEISNFRIAGLRVLGRDGRRSAHAPRFKEVWEKDWFKEGIYGRNS
jgi:hypothetical protein